jgi:Chalcone isomerase-like
MHGVTPGFEWSAALCENCTASRGFFMRRASAIVGFVLALSATTVPAKECKGTNFPDHDDVEGTDLTLNGVGLHKATFLRVDVYVGALYVAAASRDPSTLINSDRPQELILHFLRSVSVSVLRDQWTKDFVHVVPDRPASLMQRVATLNSWLSDVKRGQRLIFIRQPHEGIKLIVDGVAKGTIPGDDFSRVFMSIWLGAAPPSAGLKAGLLGGPCD